ncbi:hypothetical protein R6Q57_012574 [Mikania cordata]
MFEGRGFCNRPLRSSSFVLSAISPFSAIALVVVDVRRSSKRPLRWSPFLQPDNHRRSPLRTRYFDGGAIVVGRQWWHGGGGVTVVARLLRTSSGLGWFRFLRISKARCSQISHSDSSPCLNGSEVGSDSDVFFSRNKRLFENLESHKYADFCRSCSSSENSTFNDGFI